MAKFNLSAPNTSDPRRISAFLCTLCEEYLPHVLSNIDEDNLSEEIVQMINNLDERLQRIERLLEGKTGQE